MLKQQGNRYVSLNRIHEKWVMFGAFFFLLFLVKDPPLRKSPSQVGLFQIEMFPFGKTGVNCHSKAFELLETPTLLGSRLGDRPLQGESRASLPAGGFLSGIDDNF